MGDSCADAVGTDCADTEEPRAMFDPPLSRQRYARVADILRSEGVKRVVDFGCGGCRMIPYLKKVATIENITCVDCDRTQLEMKRFMVKPLLSDYQHQYRRKNPLSIRQFHGSLAEYDSRLCNCDAAILIEVVEHLNPEELTAMPKVLFGDVLPLLIVITTPNEEFNVLFPNFSGMRHEDHKFEWTRDEFQQWCGVQALEYGFSVEFDGVGEDPGGRNDLGHCTQLAVFHRLKEANERRSDSQEDLPYELVSEGHFPLKEDNLSKEETILMGARYYMKMDARDRPDGDSSGDPVSVSLHKLMGYPDLKDVCPDVNTLREVLERGNYKFSDDNESVLFDEEDDEDDGDKLSDEMEDVTYCTGIIDQAELNLCVANKETTLSDSVNDWSLDEAPRISVESENWSLDDDSPDETPQSTETLSERTEERLGCESRTRDEVEEDTWIPDEESCDPVRSEILERGCCARANRLKFEALSPVCGQFSDAEDDEDTLDTSIGTPV